MQREASGMAADVLGAIHGSKYEVGRDATTICKQLTIEIQLTIFT